MEEDTVVGIIVDYCQGSVYYVTDTSPTPLLSPALDLVHLQSRILEYIGQ